MFSGQKLPQNSGKNIVFALSSEIATDFIFETVTTDMILKKICVGLILEIRYRYLQPKGKQKHHTSKLV